MTNQLRAASRHWARTQINRFRQAIVLGLTLTAINQDAFVAAQSTRGRQRVEGVTNFGKVTDHYFRGGELSEKGIENLAALGIRKIIDLRDDAEPEVAETCKRLGIAYLNFPLSQYEKPDKATIDTILSHLSDTKTRTYVHCSGGKHRAGTMCALYRMKVQGWSPERAWKEQQAYGFGPPEEHPDLFLFAYGNTPIVKRLRKDPAAAEAAEGGETVVSEGGKGPSTGSSPAAQPSATTPTKTEMTKTEGIVDALSATASYVSPDKALESARANGATGNLARINLEFDRKRSVPVWKVIFANAMEYRFDAVTGALLATKEKPPEGLAVLSPLTLSKRFLTFQQIIARAERLTGQKSSEMELKSVRGRNQVFYEVALYDGVTLFFDAVSGKQIKEF